MIVQWCFAVCNVIHYSSLVWLGFAIENAKSRGGWGWGCVIDWPFLPPFFMWLPWYSRLVTSLPPLCSKCCNFPSCLCGFEGRLAVGSTAQASPRSQWVAFLSHTRVAKGHDQPLPKPKSKEKPSKRPKNKQTNKQTNKQSKCDDNLTTPRTNPYNETPKKSISRS